MTGSRAVSHTTTDAGHALPRYRRAAAAHPAWRVPPHFPDQPTASCLLSGAPESVAVSRGFTRATLQAWGLTALSTAAELVVSELVTNALRHAVPAARRPAAARPVRLRLIAQPPLVMCEVSDPGGGIPVLREPSPAAESGRGLHVVAAYSERWGWNLRDGGGKIVWALLR